ncbi:hypothetical protein IMG5_160950 [Ichthyophthirius multifiliis]|uniref:Sulphur transport domain-containing protein n=1 Tax=Ichthyophthirius multifiliis TaxID=5932 RepID=G0R005_ICHMU|nr:hypothetical protein IMG5_160950 [Ichthyophthirius multifiliis]EGR29215.1 hypothetical protein IMG5_160950 [Ichthyophthirius multifiliis]|eukprot:XP_004030451.1 hypothetical protein IMG5_160950 [Ichthyophthirius multifiliis]
MSGLISGIINYNQSHWKISIISGILVTTCIFWLIFKFEKIKNTETYIFPTPEQQLKDLNIFGFALSGFLVGIGTKLGNGCTSGHGVCGLPRLSIRSYVAPKPLFQEQFSVPPKGKVDLKLIMGAILFGIGWGFGGLCPGPSYVSFAVFSPHISVVFVGSLIIGNYLVDKINEIKQEKVQTDEIELIKKK